VNCWDVSLALPTIRMNRSQKIRLKIGKAATDGRMPLNRLAEQKQVPFDSNPVIFRL
jgi:hypothetical protein